MKDHMKKYFPERFESSGTASLANTVLNAFLNSDSTRVRIGCEKSVAEVFKYSSELNFLTKAMKRYGCDFKLSRHVVCENCYNCQGGYDPDTNQIVVCTNGSMFRDKIMTVMMHEMIHMFDVCRAKFDFNNLEHVACTEIRAANLTFCTLADKLRHGGPWYKFKNSHRYCVKDVAFKTVKAYSPETSDAEIGRIVNKVFPVCYNDLEPFGRRPVGGRHAMRHSCREGHYFGYV